MAYSFRQTALKNHKALCPQNRQHLRQQKMQDLKKTEQFHQVEMQYCRQGAGLLTGANLAGLR